MVVQRLTVVLAAVVFLGLAGGDASAAPAVSWGEPDVIAQLSDVPNGLSLAYDSQNRPHISYIDYSGGNVVKYAYWTGSTWAIQPLPQLHVTSALTRTSIALDASDNPHIACSGVGPDYAYRSGGVWSYEHIEGAPGNPSLKIGTDGMVRVAYYESGIRAYRYAERRAAGWLKDTAAPTAGQGSLPWYTCALALNSSNEPWIAYWDQGTDDAKYAYKSGSNWVQITLDGAGVKGTGIDAAFDPSGRFHVVYTDTTNRRIRHAWLDPTWKWEDIITDVSPSVDTLTMDISPSGVVGVGFRVSGAAYYARKVTNVSNWILESATGFAISTSLAFSFNKVGSPFMASGGTGTDSARVDYVRIAGGVFYRETVDDGGSFGQYGIGLTRNGQWAAYGASGYQIRARDISDSPGAGYGVADTGPNSYRYPDAALAGNDTLYIAYYNTQDTSLRVAEKPNASSGGSFYWNSWTTVDNTASVGLYPSIAAAPTTNYPHVSYFDTTNGDLRYAWKDGSGWHHQAVDTGGTVGLESSIAVNNSGHVRIAYYDSTNSRLKFAYGNGSGAGWVVQEVDNAASVGRYNSLTYDSSNGPHISYYDSTNGALKYARGPIGGWSIQTVDTGSMGSYSSIATDAQNNPHISYYDSANDDLMYAWYNGSGWTKLRLDTEGNVGQHTRIGIDGYRVTIAYYDVTNARAKYVRGWFDYTPPSTPVVVDDGDFTGGPPLNASWTSADPQTDVMRYEYAIGTSPADPGAGYVFPWTTTSLAEASEWVGGLVNGQVYYFYVRAQNRAGQWSAVGVSNGIRVVQQPTRIAHAKGLPDGTWVRLANKKVSRDPSYYFTFVQEFDRSSGIMIYDEEGDPVLWTLQAGDAVNIIGVMGHRDGQRCLYEPEIVKITSTTPPEPLYVKNKEVGGAPFMYDAGPPEIGERGSLLGYGLNNVGLLLSTSGYVTELIPDGTFYITDGSRPPLAIRGFGTDDHPPLGRFIQVVGNAQLNAIYRIPYGWWYLD